MYEMPISWRRALKVWWAFTWRNLIVALCATLISIVLGAVLAVVMSRMGIPVHTIRLVSMSIGALLGLLATVIPIKLILGKNFGEFRLVLVAHEALLDDTR